MKLYFVRGARHSAVVLASNKKEAIKRSVDVANGKKDHLVLYGDVQDWESPEAEELILPAGYGIVCKKDAK